MTGILLLVCKIVLRQGWQGVLRRGRFLLLMSQGVPTREWGDIRGINEMINTSTASNFIPHTNIITSYAILWQELFPKSYS